MQTLLINELGWNKNDNIFCQEISTISCINPDFSKCFNPRSNVRIKNPKTGGHRDFVFSSVDVNDGNIMGWNYESEDNIRLLIIND